MRRTAPVPDLLEFIVRSVCARPVLLPPPDDELLRLWDVTPFEVNSAELEHAVGDEDLRSDLLGDRHRLVVPFQRRGKVAQCMLDAPDTKETGGHAVPVEDALLRIKRL